MKSVHGYKTAPVTDANLHSTKKDKIFPGQQISVDHFVSSTKGVTHSYHGGSDHSKLYSGGCIFVDAATGLVHVEFQTHLNTHETLEAKDAFERWSRDQGVILSEFISDSGSAFTSKEFSAHLSDYRQIIHFAGTSAHHSNGIAERAIRTIMSIARTMMLHAAIHWPDMADASLWPLAVEYAVYLYNLSLIHI